MQIDVDGRMSDSSTCALRIAPCSQSQNTYETHRNTAILPCCDCTDTSLAPCRSHPSLGQRECHPQLTLALSWPRDAKDTYGTVSILYDPQIPAELSRRCPLSVWSKEKTFLCVKNNMLPNIKLPKAPVKDFFRRTAAKCNFSLHLHHISYSI